MDSLIELIKAFRSFHIAIGEEFTLIKETEGYEGFADSFIDMVKSPEIGFNTAEVNALMKMGNMFGHLDAEDLPSHHSMKLMVNKELDMNSLEDALALSVTDFKESIKDKEIGTQERTYKYEIITRVVETGNIKRVYGEEKDKAIKELYQENLKQGGV